MTVFNPNDNLNPYLSDPDVQLMLSFQQGDKAAFEALLRKYFPRLLNFIYRFVGTREIAEDITQEVFIKVYKSGSYYQPQSKFQTWVYTIAKNMSLNELRRNRKGMVSLDAPFDTGKNEMQRQMADTETLGPDQAMVQKEKVTAIRKAINSLPENQRLAVLLRRYDKFSYEQIAQTMGTSEKAVKSLLNRAKENLRTKLVKWV